MSNMIFGDASCSMVAVFYNSHAYRRITAALGLRRVPDSRTARRGFAVHSVMVVERKND